jgi:hypothetical protein
VRFTAKIATLALVGSAREIAEFFLCVLGELGGFILLVKECTCMVQGLRGGSIKPRPEIP